MSPFRVLLLVLVPAWAVEAAIFYLLVGLGADEETIVYVEMIWLVIASGIGGVVSVRLLRDR